MDEASSCEIVLIWMSLGLTDDKSTLVDGTKPALGMKIFLERFWLNLANFYQVHALYGIISSGFTFTAESEKKIDIQDIKYLTAESTGSLGHRN